LPATSTTTRAADDGGSELCPVALGDPLPDAPHVCEADETAEDGLEVDEDTGSELGRAESTHTPVRTAAATTATPTAKAPRRPGSSRSRGRAAGEAG